MHHAMTRMHGSRHDIVCVDLPGDNNERAPTAGMVMVGVIVFVFFSRARPRVIDYDLLLQIKKTDYLSCPGEAR